MAKIISVKFVRHSAPYMPGEVAGFPEEQAKDLHARGIAFMEGPVAASPERPSTDFDPARAEIEEVRAFIIGRGESIPADASESAIRKAADKLLKAQK